LVADTAPNTSVPLTIWRNNKEISLSVSIGEMPKDVASLAKAGPDSQQGDHALTGLSVAPVKPGQTPEGHGVVVTHITPNSPADRAGIRAGDILIEINRSGIRSVQDFEHVASDLDSNASVLILIQRGKGTIFLTIKP
jgi:serine protease Do